jgi:pimeloyl-ACP methyl ester carboxylesterase
LDQNNAMSKCKSHLFFCGFLFFGAASAHGQQLPSAIFTDPAPDKEFPADVAAPDVMSHGARMNAVLYVAAGRGPHPVVILVPGFPGNEKNLDLAYSLRRAGWNTLLAHFRGSWGSEGVFSFSNAIEDLQAAILFLRDAENAKKYGNDPKKIVLIGHSLGGFMAASAAARDPEIAGLVMIAAWNIGATMTGPRETHRIDAIPAASSRLPGTTPAGLQAEAEANAAKWNYLDYAEALKTRPVLILEAHDRNLSYNKDMKAALQKAGNTRVTETYVETDHSFSDHRIALQVAVLEWLQSVFTPAAK